MNDERYPEISSTETILKLAILTDGQVIAEELGLKLEDEQAAGANIVRRAIEAPLRKIASNPGVEGSIVVDKVNNAKGAQGFNASAEEYEDLLKAGVIDPTKVVRTALQNAPSVAALLLTTEAMVTEKPEAKGGGMPGMM